MKQTMKLILVSLMMFVAAPVFAGQAMQVWKCELDENASEAAVMAMASTWLQTARKIPGGEHLEAYVNFPVAVNDTGESDLFWVVVAPTFEEWGKFWDAYGESEVAKLEETNREMIVCPDSAVWESFKVE
jgi:hypothetical protein